VKYPENESRLSEPVSLLFGSRTFYRRSPTLRADLTARLPFRQEKVDGPAVPSEVGIGHNKKRMWLKSRLQVDTCYPEYL